MTALAPEARLFVDETYREAVYGNDPGATARRRPRTARADRRVNLKVPRFVRPAVGWLTVPDRDLRERLISAKINTIVSCSVIGEALAATSSHAPGCAKQGGHRYPKPEVFDAAAVGCFWARLLDNDVQLAPGRWFGEEPRVFRLSFGYLPLERLKEALLALSTAIDAVKG